jgi:hypothetical protein
LNIINFPKEITANGVEIMSIDQFLVNFGRGGLKAPFDDESEAFRAIKQPRDEEK